MNVNGLLTKRWLSHLESNQNSGYQKPVCSRYTMGQAELRILYHISFAHRPGMCICHASNSSASKNAFVLACMPGAFDSRGPATFNTNAEDIPSNCRNHLRASSFAFAADIAITLCDLIIATAVFSVSLVPPENGSESTRINVA